MPMKSWLDETPKEKGEKEKEIKRKWGREGGEGTWRQKKRRHFSFKEPLARVPGLAEAWWQTRVCTLGEEGQKEVTRQRQP